MDRTSPGVKVSLLWPAGNPHSVATAAWEPSAIADLDLETLIDSLTINHRYREMVRCTLLELGGDANVIGYRQDVLHDLLVRPELVATFEAILPKLMEVGYLGGARSQTDTPLHQVLWRLGELELYAECVIALENALTTAEPVLLAAGLKELLGALRCITADGSFRALIEHLPEMQSALNGLHSVTIGVNLDHLLRPVEATLLSVSNEVFAGSTFLGKLFGNRKPGEGIGPLHHIDVAALPDVSQHPFMQPLFRDLDQVIRSAVRPIADFMAQYARVSSQFLLGLEQELAYYVGAVRFVNGLREQGLSLCRPECAPVAERVTDVEGIYNVNLALRLAKQVPAKTTPAIRNDAATTPIVLNDVHFGDEGRIYILTGPNRGGKTTYTQAVGLAHVLHQAGLLVPGKKARLSPADSILTHFPMAEEYNRHAGRLGEEAQRLEVIFRRATPHSLVLLNESLFSTSPGESLYLARDVVRALRYLGARAIYATHLHELAADVDQINRQTPGASLVASLVATVEPIARGKLDMRPSRQEDEVANPTFRILPGPPMGLSYARQIAERYGISFQQLAAAINDRVGKRE